MLLYRRTKNLEIRPLELSDYEAWKEAYSEMLPQKNKWDRIKRDPVFLKKSDFTALLRDQKKAREQDRFFDLAVFHLKSGSFVGNVAAMDLIRGVAQSAFLGYAIFNRHWGQGFGKESVKAMLEIAFKDLKLHRLEAGIEPTNRRSIMLAKSLGFRKEGLKEGAVFLRGEWVDLSVYAMTCEDLGLPWKGVTKVRQK